MKKNVGSIDRVLRIIVAIIIGALYFTQVITGALGITLLAVAVILMLTAFAGFCPLYFISKISTSAKH